MNKILKNHSGYTLVTVLLVLTLFMMIAVTFWQQATNSAKQNEITEENTQSVALAEMGTLYYKNIITNEFDDIVKQADAFQQEYLKKLDQNKLTEQDIYDSRDAAVTVAYNLLETRITALFSNKPPNIDNGAVKFKVDDNILISSLKDNKTTIIFNTSGYVNGVKGASIQSEIEIDFKEMYVETEIEDGSGGESETSVNLISDPDPNDTFRGCGSTLTFESIDCTSNNSLSFPQSEKISIKKAKIKVKGNLTYGNLNNDDFQNSTLYVLGNFDNGNQNKLENARIYVKGNAEFSNLNNANNLTIQVDGTASFGQMNNGNNILVCANTIKSVGQIGDGVHIYAKINNSGNNKVIVGKEAFTAGGACSGTSGGTGAKNNITWQAPAIINEEYRY